MLQARKESSRLPGFENVFSILRSFKAIISQLIVDELITVNCEGVDHCFRPRISLIVKKFLLRHENKVARVRKTRGS